MGKKDETFSGLIVDNEINFHSFLKHDKQSFRPNVDVNVILITFKMNN
jgi:hypothetical protein